MKRKICIVTGTRADWGLLSRVAQALNADANVELQIVATNMHLSEKYGSTWREIEECGLHITRMVPMSVIGDGAQATVEAMSQCMSGMAQVFSELRPHLLLILGDRYEMLAVASAALIFRIPIAHIAGGAVSRGAYDESIRHSITKMSHLHLTETDEYRRRVIQLGENPANVHNVGAMGVYNINHMQYLTREQLEQELGTDIPQGTLLCTFHPATLDVVEPRVQCENLLRALDRHQQNKVIFTYPNNDTNGEVIIEMINAYADANPHRVAVFASLGMRRYLSALHCVAAVIGNSSSGIVEVPSVHIPTLDIGIRQQGRLSADSVIHCGVSETEISQGLDVVLSQGCQQFCKSVKNPYEQPDTLERIVDVVCNTPLNNIILKPFYDIS
ncbi:MAG: UDP-N-acetylglucosamine 2-epimerase [Muribaculaceae bacterium]